MAGISSATGGGDFSNGTYDPSNLTVSGTPEVNVGDGSDTASHHRRRGVINKLLSRARAGTKDRLPPLALRGGSWQPSEGESFLDDDDDDDDDEDGGRGERGVLERTDSVIIHDDKSPMQYLGTYGQSVPATTTTTATTTSSSSSSSAAAAAAAGPVPIAMAPLAVTGGGASAAHSHPLSATAPALNMHALKLPILSRGDRSPRGGRVVDQVQEKISPRQFSPKSNTNHGAFTATTASSNVASGDVTPPDVTPRGRAQAMRISSHGQVMKGIESSIQQVVAMFEEAKQPLAELEAMRLELEQTHNECQQALDRIQDAWIATQNEGADLSEYEYVADELGKDELKPKFRFGTHQLLEMDDRLMRLERIVLATRRRQKSVSVYILYAAIALFIGFAMAYLT